MKGEIARRQELYTTPFTTQEKIPTGNFINTNSDSDKKSSGVNFGENIEDVPEAMIPWSNKKGREQNNFETKGNEADNEKNSGNSEVAMPPPQTVKEESIKSTGEKPMQSGKRKCTPVENVVFLKTHKTGSSTVLNIFQRYSERHNLPMALPMVNKFTHLFKWPSFFNQSFVFEHEKGRKYNLLANHARFSKTRILEVMSDPGKTKFITIFREPLFQMESMFSYFHFNKSINMPEIKNLHDFLRVVEKDRKRLVTRLKEKNSLSKLLGKNPNAFDLGHNPWLENSLKVSQVIDTVQNEFNLVMISEYMLESLVLLKDELCWDLEDVVYFTLNKRPKKYRHKFDDIRKDKNVMSSWSRLDHALYQYFNDTLWLKIKSKGDQFQKDVQKLREMNKELEEKCIDHGTHYDKTQPWFPILGYKIKDEARGSDYFELCKQIIRPEIEYTLHLAEKQTRTNFTMPASYKKRITNA